MRKLQDLSDAEKSEFAQDMTDASVDAIESVIRVADKYGISRDETMKQFSIVLLFSAKADSFENYEISEEEANENRG